MSEDLLEDPDVEDLLIAWVPTALTGQGFTLPVSSRKTAKECVVIYRVGGPDRDLVTGLPLVKFDVYAATEMRASAILRRLVGLIKRLPGSGEMSGVVYRVDTFQGPTNDPRPPDDLVRYTATLQLAIRKSVVI